MSRLDDVGEVSTDGATTIRWTIPRFMQTPKEVSTVLFSPEFDFRGEEMCWLSARPNASEYCNTEGWMDIGCFIFHLPRGSAVHFSIVDREDKEMLHTGAEKDGDLYARTKWILRAELEARMEEFLHGGQLRILFRVVFPGESGHGAEDGVSGSNLGECSRSKSNTQQNEGLVKLAQNFKGMFVEGKDCDFVIKVKGREFPTHRLILKARISVFEAMLTHDTLENKEGVLNIDDCDPDVFHEFLLFVYSGRVENLSPDNVCGLYVLADKYGLQELKDMCLDFMKISLNVEIICDVIGLATTYGEAELLKLATEFFVKNAEQILETDNWHQFLKENSKLGTELILKTLKLGKRKRAFQ